MDRPRSRAARRRPPTALTPRDAALFPSLTTARRPVTAAAPVKRSLPLELPQSAPLDERLHAHGLKRSLVQTHNNQDERPLAGDRLNKRALVPSRPQRGSSEDKQPMSARDRYYRASTAPTGRSRPTNAPEEGAKEIPRRNDLLGRRSEVRTLTERLVEGLEKDGGPVPRDSFFYLRRVDSNPYNMEVTTHSRIDPTDYYTVSRLGVTHFAADGVEFQSLDKFERENYIYSLLVKLSFFRKYRIWKRFTLWKQAVSARKRMDAYVSLNNSLFILLPHLHEALLELRNACLDFHQANLFDFEHPTGATGTAVWGGEVTDGQLQQKTYTLSEFSLRLKAQKMRVERLVDLFISEAEMTAKKACENYLYAFLQSTGFNDRAPAENAADDRRRSSLMRSAHRKESRASSSGYAKLGEQKVMTYTERATMRTQCRRLTKFLRVVEFLISDALLRMAISSTVCLKSALASYTGRQDDEGSSSDENMDREELKSASTLSLLPPQASVPLFRVELILKSSASPAYSSDVKCPMDFLEFTPSAEGLRSQLETLVFNGLMAVTNRDRLIRNPMFKVYVEASLDEGAQGEDGDNDGAEVTSEGMDLDILIMEDSTFVETLQRLNSIVLDGFERAEENCEELSVFLARYLDNGQFCKQVLDPSRYLHTDAHDFQEFLDKYIQETQEVDRLADSASCGLLLLDRVKLNAQLKPSPRKCLDALHKLVPVVFRQLNDTLINEMTAMNDRISMVPTTVDEFSASLAFLRELQAGQDAIDERYRSIRSLYHLLEEYKVKFTDTDQMNAFMLTQKLSQLKSSMDLFESTCEQYTAKFGIELEARLPNLVSKLTNVSNALSNQVLFDLKSDINDTIVYLTRTEGDVMQLESAVKQHFLHEKTLGLPLSTAFEDLDSLKADLALKIDMWKALREWRGVKSDWDRKQFPDEVDVPSITEHVETFYTQSVKWEENLSVGMGALCTHLKADVEKYRVTMPILTDLRCPSFEERHFAQLRELLGFGMRHLGLHRAPTNASSVLTLGELVEMHLSPFGTQINRIATEATQERLLKDTLSKIVTLWERLEFDVMPYKETKEYYVLSGLETVYTTLEESLIGMTSVISSKFLAPIKDMAMMWQKRLLLFQETFDAWIECQRKWMHLETIFAAPDIQKQLPNEGATFLAVNQFWKDLMRRTRDQRSCLKITGAILIGASSNAKSFKDGANSGSSNTCGVGQALLDSLTKHNSSLERIEKSLEDYLETKRRSFPRFYFISNDELLEMLAHAKEPQIVQRHLPKCFDALAKLDISDDGPHGASNVTMSSQDIVAMISPEGERVAFGRPLKARGNVEDWLNAVLASMKITLHRHVKSCLADYQHAAREVWLFRHPAQAVAVVSYITWARECEFCFKAASKDPTRELSLWHQTICAQLSNLTRLVRTSLTSVQRRVVVSLVTTDVHFRDVVESLIAKHVVEATDFLWEQQLRYQWYAEYDECEIHQANCRIKYGYEYMGACSRLVITPLTDRCWMTITGALELRYGAAPSGPAGTGKTETSKDLAKALGILCVVINCSSQMSYTMMGKIFNGVVQAGTWVCLDEFNRIDIEVLSVVGQQMAALRNARLMDSSEVLLDGRCVSMRDHHVIITMNPGYAGRTELPDNLKVSFRPVAMMVPDYALIAEIVLFAEGFQLAKPLSRKVTKLYKLCSEQLSQQAHYDFGMRAVRSVLTMAGSLKRSSASTTGPTGTEGTPVDPASVISHDESIVLIKAMVGANTPKLTDEDTLLFQGIVRDLFPDIISSMGPGEVEALLQGVGASSSSTPTSGNSLNALEEELDEQLRRNCLQGPPQWKKKTLHLFATLEVRVGVVQTGPSGSGKSTALRILKAALNALRERHAHPDLRFQRVISFTLNPKAISMVELYGFFHPSTHEWTDGLASKLLRTCIMEKNEEILARQLSSSASASDSSTWNLPFYWIVFDGPIDANWIESMNTVLDDNMTLCLANGERIKLLPRIQLLFEVADTSAASPATISRLGVVYYHPSYLGWHPYVETWVSKLAVSLPPAVTQTSPTKETSARIPINAKTKSQILKYFELFIASGLAFLRASTNSARVNPKVPIVTCELAFVASICHIFQALLEYRAPAELFVSTAPRGSSARAEDTPNTGTSTSSEETRRRCLDLMFIFSFAWSIGGNLNLDQHKAEFQEFLYDLISSHEKFFSEDILAVDGKIPSPTGLSQATGDIHDFFIDFQYFSLSPWASSFLEQTQQLQIPSRVTSGRVLVPTLDILKYRYLVELISVDARLPVLLTGATGSGKSAMVNHILDIHARIAADIDPSEFDADSPLAVIAHGKVLPLILNLSAQTSSGAAQLSMESKFAKKRRTLLGAPVNKQLVVVFVDDVNMPSVEASGAQPVIELLRQYMEFEGFYDREKFFWKDVRDSVLIAAGGLPGGGRQILCPRFVRHFSAVLCLPSCDEAAMQAIFNAHLASHIAGRGGVFAKNVKDTLLQTADATCELYQRVVQGLLPTPSKCHYTFNLRDTTKLIQGVLSGTRSYALAPSPAGSQQPTSALTASTVINLWAHESIRVFRDRLMDNRDRTWFSEQLVEVANSIYGLSWTIDNVFETKLSGRQRKQHVEGGESPPKQDRNLLLFSPRRVETESSAPVVRYAQVNDLARYEAFLTSQIDDYNASANAKTSCRSPLQLVLFEDAMIHTAAIARILMQPRGHALLLGMGGCGKRSLTRLATYVAGYRCFEIEQKKNHGLVDFREDLKALMKLSTLGQSSDSKPGQGTMAGEEVSMNSATPTVFLLNDSQLTSDAFLEDINTILNGGDIPKLFASDELEIIISNVRTLLERLAADAKSQTTADSQAPDSSGGDFTRKDCEDFFHTMVQNSLHFVICMNPLRDTFRAHVRQFPALINCTTIDYFDEWPKSALEYVAECYLSREEPPTPVLQVTGSTRRISIPSVAGSPITRLALSALCVEVHQSVSALAPAFLAECKRRVFITSQHYLDLITLFQRIYRETKARWEIKLQRLTTGVVKLEDTNALVSTLQNELVGLQPVLLNKAKEAEELLKQVAVDQAEAELVAERVGSDEAQVKRQQQEIAACQADAQRDLDQALPALNAAVAALDALDKKDITEVKGFVKPPQAVQVVMEAVCIMLGEKADWDTSKRILSRSTFMAELKEYDKDNIPAGILKKIHKYIENPDFAVDEVKKVSHAAMSLCMWVHAIDTYARVFREVAPKRQRLAEMNAVLEKANAMLAAKQQELAKVLSKVQKLKEKCDTTLAEKQRLIEESQLTQRRLQNAEKLTVGLADERIRWKNSIKVLKQEGHSILGDSFLAAACMSYLGPFDASFRDRVLSRWIDTAQTSLGVSSEFALVSVSGDAQELREWHLLGLPSDSFSANNAICVLKSKQRWALMIDPQQQATQWIKRLEVLNHLETVKNDDAGLMQVVEECLSTGKPLLIEEVAEALDPSLEPVLALKAYSGSNLSRKTQVKLGDRLVEADTYRFRLYLTTKLSNPHFVPDVFIRVNVVNFTVTSDGLEEQLLSDVVLKERMEVEERKHTLLASIARDQKQLHDIEIKILNLLSDAKGNILDDIELIQALETSKQTSTVVAQRLRESEATKLEVLEIRNQYHPVAVRGALLFFIVTDLSDIDPMYQYSLEYFTRLFNLSLNEAPAKRRLAERLESLQNCITLSVYRNICRGLFQAHRLLFAFAICLRIKLKANELTDRDVALLDQSALSINRNDTVKSDGSKIDVQSPEEPTSQGINSDDDVEHKHNQNNIEDALLALGRSSSIFNKVLDSFLRDSDAWNMWIARDNPYAARLPGDLDVIVSSFARLVIVRWLREDAFTTAVRCFVEQTLGAEYVNMEGNVALMTEVFSDVDKTTPGLFILSPGADPVSVVESYARVKGVSEDRYHVISLGQGQGPIAEAKLNECKAEGDWLFLQNVHLAKSWLPRLQSILATLKQEARSGEIHKDFRVFLASYPVTYFPISILQSSVKIMTEPPKGIKANLHHSMVLLKQMDAHAHSSSTLATTKLRLAFGLGFFHAVIRERAKFGTLGWNLKYDFSDADFVSVVTLQRRLVDSTTIASDDFNVEEAAGNAITNNDEPRTSDTFNSKAVPWNALLFLAGEIYYGGRVTDELDRRCLMAVLRRFCSEASLTAKPEPQRRGESLVRGLTKMPTRSRIQSTPEVTLFSQTGTFSLPQFRNEAEISRFIDELPDLDGPQIFGMHPNAHVSYQRQQSQNLLKLVLQLQPPQTQVRANSLKASDEADSAETPDQSVEHIVLSVCKEIDAKLPAPSTLLDAEDNVLVHCRANPLDPLNVVLQQELAACHKVVRFVRGSLKELQDAIRGIAVMSVVMEKTLQSLSLHTVPADWNNSDAHAIPTTQSLTQWVAHQVFRCDFLHRWALSGRTPGNSFPLSVFSFPQGLFTAILQRYARQQAIPIHFLDLQFRVLEENEFAGILAAEVLQDEETVNDNQEEAARSSSDAVYLTGLVLEGAWWNNEAKCLCSSQPGVMRQTMPAIHVIPYPDTTLNVLPSNASNAQAPSSLPKEQSTSKRNLESRTASRIKGSFRRADEMSSRNLLLGGAPSSNKLVEEEDAAPKNKYSCPVYRTNMRKGTLSTTGTSTNLVLSMDLPCDRDPDHFILNGTALVCNIVVD